MKRVYAALAVCVLVALSVCVSAAVQIETVIVGDPGNVADTRYVAAGYGSVGYTYGIGTYEVTAGQYTEFLNAMAKTDTYGLYSTKMMDLSPAYIGCNIVRTGESGSYSYSVDADRANRPVNYISYWDACRFVNWLHNGQRTGLQDASTTEDGVYTLNGYNADDGRSIQRNVDWTWALANENEWYKAAYYKGGGVDAGYWDYATQSNSAPGRDRNDASGNNANYFTTNYLIGNPYWRTEVGDFQNSDSAYGTFDQTGNINEWVESFDMATAKRALRGGAFDNSTTFIKASSRISFVPTFDYYMTGFRVVRVVPEPSSMIALVGGLAGLMGFMRRRK